ncbi:MAG: dUTP diphosphatase [Firmicutes bacterium]|nr:dUTP diphosphatase [Bacillota bacterium]
MFFNQLNYVKILKLKENATIPTRGTSGSAGYDLYACTDREITIFHGDLVKIPCGIAIEIPESYAAFIFARSGLGINHGIIPSNAVGVIDSDYRGEIQVGLCSVSKNGPYVVKNGDRIAQLIVMRTEVFKFKEVESLSESDRGINGFGSTGF